MTQITIPLVAGRNYISFPATSMENFGTILAGIKTNIEYFYKYDPILSPYWTAVIDTEYIEQGRGYLISMISPADITYDGMEHIITLDQLISKLLRGWNLIGTGSNILYIPNWCKTVDPISGFPVTQLEPNKSYWVDYYECLIPTTSSILLILTIGLGISILSLYLSLRDMKIKL